MNELRYPLHWQLITTPKIETREAALAMVRTCRKRWTIKEYLHDLKTGGFNVERAQVGAPQAMMALAAACATWVFGRLGGWPGYHDKHGPKTLSQSPQPFERIRQWVDLGTKDM